VIVPPSRQGSDDNSDNAALSAPNYLSNGVADAAKPATEPNGESVNTLPKENKDMPPARDKSNNTPTTEMRPEEHKNEAVNYSPHEIEDGEVLPPSDSTADTAMDVLPKTEKMKTEDENIPPKEAIYSDFSLPRNEFNNGINGISLNATESRTDVLHSAPNANTE
jgi:hypothetical protein